MPFPPANTPKAYTKANVAELLPDQIGCYGLFGNGIWIYVGSGDIRARLLAHLNGDNACITKRAPTHWVDVVTPDYIAQEKRLILELQPACNKKVG